MSDATALVVVVTNLADANAATDWLRAQMPDGAVAVATGYHACVAAIARQARAVVANIGVPSGREDWRLAELRERNPEATIGVVADAGMLPRLVDTLRADTAVTSVDDLPPLRELLVTPELLVEPDQTSWRRTTR
jgi:alpha/beta superfamily hydrolase